MLTLLIMLILVVVMVSLMGRMARARRRAYEEQLREAERAADGRDDDGGAAYGSFGMFPFGGLLESLMTGAGARSFRWDPETGQWVEMTDELPEQEPDAETEPEPAAGDGDRPRRRRRRRPAPHGRRRQWARSAG